MHTINTNDDKQTIRIERKPTFMVGIDYSYVKFLSNPDLINHVSSNLANNRNKVASELYGMTDIYALLQEQIDSEKAGILEKKITTPYTCNITIKDKDVFNYITKSYNDDVLGSEYLTSENLDQNFVRNTLSTRLHLIKLLKSGSNKEEAIKIIKDKKLVEYLYANVDKITYTETEISYSHTQTYFEFLCLLYPDRLILVYNEVMDDLIICDAKNLAYAFDLFMGQIIILSPKVIYHQDDLDVYELRKNFGYSIVDYVQDVTGGLMTDESISSFEIHKKADNIIIKTTRTGNHADSVAKRIGEYGEIRIKKHNQNKVYEITITEKIAKKDFLEMKS